MTNVLIVDDSDDIRLALRTILEEVGHDVHELSDGVEVLPWLQSNAPDMILLDVAMPIQDGFQTLSELSAYGRYSHIPVIMALPKAERRICHALARCKRATTSASPGKTGKLNFAPAGF